MRFVFLTFIYVLLSLQSGAQKGNAEQKEAMQKLKWMVGNWTGTSTININQQTTLTSIRESVQVALDGSVLLINVRATDTDTATHHQSLAYTSFSVISYDTKTKTYRWTSWRTNGNDYEERLFTVGNNSFEYSSHENDRTIRYRAKQGSKGEFLETGEYLREASVWQPFITMKLLKSKR